MSKFYAVCILLGVGLLCSAQVVINEVGWAGTTASGYDEWIELYNPSDEPLDLSGWVLVLGDREVPLAGEIPAGGFFLLERTDDTTVSDVAADLIYKGALPNIGAVVRLLDPGGRVVDTANRGCARGWWAGGGDPRASMERISPDLPDSPVAWRSGVEGAAHDSSGDPIHGSPGAANAATSALLPVTLSLPGEVLSGPAEVAWEVEGGGDVTVYLFISTDGGGTWELLAGELPPVGTFSLDTSRYPNGQALIAVGAFDDLGSRGGAVRALMIEN